MTNNTSVNGLKGQQKNANGKMNFLELQRKYASASKDNLDISPKALIQTGIPIVQLGDKKQRHKAKHQSAQDLARRKAAAGCQAYAEARARDEARYGFVPIGGPIQASRLRYSENAERRTL